MKILPAAAALAAALTIPAHAADWLTSYSYACQREDLLKEIGYANEIGHYDKRDRMLARRQCFLINNAAKVSILFEKGDMIFFRARAGGQPRLWTWSRNIRRGR